MTSRAIPLGRSDRLIASVALMVATAMQAADATIANVALPRLEHDLGGGIVLGAWVMTSHIASLMFLWVAWSRCGIGVGPGRLAIGSEIWPRLAAQGVGDMAQRHPLAEKLYKLRNQKLTTEELIATLEMAQLEVEKIWNRKPAAEGSACGHPGCNYRRYPASKFCMYHVTGNDTFAARSRRSKNL
jgi:hypothetical protein